MKYLILLLLSFNCFADNYHQFSARYRIGEEISHLEVVRDIGGQFDFRREIGPVFYEGSVYASKSNLSDTQGANIGLGFNYEGHSISINLMADQNFEQWRIKEGDCKACDLDWINHNSRTHVYVKYQFHSQYFNPIIEYHKIVKDRDELMKDRIYYGLRINTDRISKDMFAKIMSDGNLTTFNIGFKY